MVAVIITAGNPDLQGLCMALAHGSQLIIASHSEEALNQAAGTSEDSVVAFLGRPHRIPRNRTTAIRRALDTVRYDQYYLAEQSGWVARAGNRR